MKEKNYEKEKRPTASMAWVLVGAVFGILGVIVALITNNGDGRVSKTFGGFLIGLLITALCTLIVLAMLGPAIGNHFSNIIDSINPTIAPTP